MKSRMWTVLACSLLAVNLAFAAALTAERRAEYKECGYQVGQTQGWCVNLIWSECQTNAQCVRTKAE
jgi:hypothetical protein